MMRSILAIIVALGLAALAVMAFMRQEWLLGTAFLAGALAIVLPALAGRGLGDVGDADLMVQFVRDPFETIVDETLERLAPDNEPAREKRAPDKPAPAYYPLKEPGPAFDADAAFARYMAKKASGEIAAEAVLGPAPSATPMRTFGRKGV